MDDYQELIERLRDTNKHTFALWFDAADAIESLLAENERLNAELAKYRDAPVVAYVNFADNGNIRIWTSASDHAMHIAEDQGFVLQRLIVKPVENK